MFRIITIASGSKSNAWAVQNDGSVLLFDCGVSGRTLVKTLKDCGLSTDSIDAVFITHSHSDHTKGIQVISKSLNCKFYSAVDVDGCEKMTDSITVGGMTVSFFPCSHDVPCVGYKIECGDRSVCLATDSGVVTDGMKEALVGCETVILESNHDTDMLRSGPYPPSLKMRISSNEGHLSNTACAECILSLADKGLKRAVLAHLSEVNNYPLMARATTESALKKYGIRDIEILTASPGLEIVMD